MECDGKITQLTLLFNAANAGRVVVAQKKDHVVIFDGMVAPGEEFTFNGTEKDGIMRTEIEISVDGSLNSKIHTSCSQPVGPGLVSGDFVVVEAYSHKGGKACPLPEPPECMACDGKITRLTLRYNGANAGQVVVAQKKDHVVIFDDFVVPGDEFTFNGTERSPWS